MCGFPVYSTPQLCGGTDQKERDMSDVVFLACLIPPVCHRVCYVWGGLVHDQVLDITPTFLTSNVLSTLWQVDHVANQMSKAELGDNDYGFWHKS
jgi:hypothetical protein